MQTCTETHRITLENQLPCVEFAAFTTVTGLSDDISICSVKRHGDPTIIYFMLLQHIDELKV